jgi:tRNA 2-thiouridine synthesizing protein A
MTQDQHSDETATIIDARGLSCPLPVLRLRKRLMNAAPGAVLELLATDRTALRDVPAFCEAQGHQITVLPETAGTLRFRIVKVIIA